MQYYEGLVIPRKDSSSPKVASTVMALQTRVFCLRADKSQSSDCINITCENCLFDEDKNSNKFSKWFTEMKEAFAQKHSATIH